MDAWMTDHLHPDSTGELRNLQGWKPSPPDPRDYLLADHRPDILATPALAYVNLLSLFLPIEDQGQLGSCTAFGTGGPAEAVTRKQGLTQVQMSKLAQYYWSRLVGGLPVNQDTGAYVRDAMKAASVKSVLASGYPVAVGFSVWQGFMSTGRDGMVPRGTGSIIGGHCVAVIGNDDSTGRWIMRNSWGTGWGDIGYCYMLYDDLIRYGADFWFASEVEGPVVPVPVPPTPGKPWTITTPDTIVHHLTEV